MLLHQTFDQTAGRLPDKVALVCGDRRYTFRELDERAQRLAGFLQAQGISRGDRVALLLPNGVELVIAIWATLRVGAVFMPINPQTKAAKLQYMLEDSTPACLVCAGSLAFIWEKNEAARLWPPSSKALLLK